MSSASKSGGFTLIEMMIAITLGLIVSAVALQLFLTSQRSVTTQQALFNLQGASIFGLDSLVRDIRLANLNASQPIVNDQVLFAGIVFSGANISNNLNADGHSNFSIKDNLLTKSNIGFSNLKDKSSDQLVIQYQVKNSDQFDCEGRSIAANTYVVQRYFLRKDVSRNEPNEALALACRAERYTEELAKSHTTLDLSNTDEKPGEVLIPRVDHFAVRLGIAYDGANTTCDGITKSAVDTAGKSVVLNIEPDTRLDCFGYMTIEDYMALKGTKPQIVSIQIGLLVRSSETVGRNEFFNKDKVYQILNTSGQLIENSKNSLYLRSVVTQTIAIRNGFGVQN